MTLQPQYSLIVREIEWEIVPAALDAGLGLLPWSPLGGGWLTGKYQRDQRPTGDTRLGDDPGRGMEAWDRRGTARTWDIIEAVQRVADGARHLDGRRSRWPGSPTARASPRRSSAPARCEQLEDNLSSVDVRLDDDERRGPRRRPATCTLTDYPYGEMGIDQRDRDLATG